MPLYEYRCHGCGKNLELLQKATDPVKKKCPECGGKLEKLVSSSAFHLKGTGWYKTDYASPKKENKSEAPVPKPKETKPA